MKPARYIVFLALCSLFLLPAQANDTVYVSGEIQHEGLLDWSPVMYHSNSYVDLSVHYVNDSNNAHFHSLRASTRGELTQWPMPGFEADFGGYGMSHLSVAAAFDWGEITVGDVYGQFGSGMLFNVYEDRAMGIDGALRGGKIELTPWKGLHFTLIGGKQRRYWSCYKDRAFGWNYGRDAVIAGDVELHIEQWSRRMQENDMHLTIGGSYVSKYEQPDTIMFINDGMYMYNLPRWVGAGEVRAQWQMRGWNVMAEYAHKANDPCIENHYSYDDGNALLVSAGYSRKGLSVLGQMKMTRNMAFRSERQRNGIAGRINHMPAFSQQHTYALAALYPYATQYVPGELAFQGEVLYTWPKKSPMGGRYGTTMKWSGSHIRGLYGKNENYTDVNMELHKRLSKSWWLNAVLMYQAYNQLAVEGHGGMIRSGIAVVDARVHVTNKVSMRGELQYLYTPDYEGQWFFALYEVSLWQRLTLSGQWMYNIGGTTEATHEHYYTFSATYSHAAHRLTAGYTKTRDGFNCSGGVCRWVPKMEGVSLNYSFTW